MNWNKQVLFGVLGKCVSLEWLWVWPLPGCVSGAERGLNCELGAHWWSAARQLRMMMMLLFSPNLRVPSGSRWVVVSAACFWCGCQGVTSLSPSIIYSNTSLCCDAAMKSVTSRVLTGFILRLSAVEADRTVVLRWLQSPLRLKSPINNTWREHLQYPYFFF